MDKSNEKKTIVDYFTDKYVLHPFIKEILLKNSVKTKPAFDKLSREKINNLFLKFKSFPKKYEHAVGYFGCDSAEELQECLKSGTFYEFHDGDIETLAALGEESKKRQGDGIYFVNNAPPKKLKKVDSAQNSGSSRSFEVNKSASSMSSEQHGQDELKEASDPAISILTNEASNAIKRALKSSSISNLLKSKVKDLNISVTVTKRGNTVTGVYVCPLCGKSRKISYQGKACSETGKGWSSTNFVNHMKKHENDPVTVIVVQAN